VEFEKLGAFYLGKGYDIEAREILDELVMYDARDLTTHAVCVGMTGSGKTGLCIDLLEEAAIDQVPAIILDPKGDITNLLLQFPELLPEDFKPWVNLDDARRKGLGLDAYATQQADLWRKGLAGWGQEPSRIQLLKDSAEFQIFTPGSDAGTPVSVLRSFAAPRGLDWEADAEILRERIQGNVSALLGLMGLEADPVRSREHILLSSLFEYFWKKGEDLDLAKLILSIQNPPVRRFGVFEVDTFFPPKDRFELAMSLNNIIASPAFAPWLTGAPLDVPSFLANSQGKPRHSIFYLAHLSDTERMFCVTLLLNEILAWTRAQPGTTSLRAVVYMDEIFGYFPPVENPPSKKPMLTLLKQARAYGVGLVLATQNPVDLDYKGLTNAGTWFVGRLQTERDKARLLDGLETATSAVGKGLNKKELSSLISDLGKRVFLMHNIHDEVPTVFQTRWAMSYLRGPLTRPQIQELMKDKLPSQKTEAAEKAGPKRAELRTSDSEAFSTAPPALSPGIDQLFVSVKKDPASVVLEVGASEGAAVKAIAHDLVYRPAVYGAGRIHYVDRRRKVEESQDFMLIADTPEGAGAFRWEEACSVEVSPSFGTSSHEGEALFGSLPETLNDAREFNALRKDLADYLYRTSVLELLYIPSLKEFSTPGETERDFAVRLKQASREARDEEVDELTSRFERKLARLTDRVRKAQIMLEKKQATADARNREFMVSVGESLLGMFMGRRSLRTASSSLGKYRMKTTSRIGIEEAEEKVEALNREMASIEEQLRAEVDAIKERWESALLHPERVPVTPRRNDVEIEVMALVWEPHWRVCYADPRGVKRTRVVPAT
jgi:hypothetical protein